MRIPTGVTDQIIYFVALDATDLKTRETGLSSFTVYRARNGAAAAAYTTPTVTEVDATNMPGVYTLLLDEDMAIAAGNDSEEIAVHITHAGMAGVTRAFELYRRTVTAGETAGVSSGAVSNVTANADMRGTDSAATAASIAALNDISTVDVNAQVDSVLNGYDLATATNLAVVDGIVDAILVDTDTVIPALIAALNDLSAAQVNAEVDTGITDAALATAASLAAAQTDLDTITDTGVAATNMRGTDSAYTGTPPAASAIADAVWDELQAGHVIAGSFGLYLDAAISGVSVGGGLTAQQVADALKLAPAAGSPAAGSVNADLDTLISRTAGGVTFNYVTAHAPDTGTLRLVRGEARLAALGNAIEVDITHPAFSAAMTSDGTTVELKIAKRTGGTAEVLTGDIDSVSGTTATIKVDLTAAIAATLTPGDRLYRHDYEFKMAGADASRITPVANKAVSVTADIPDA